MKVAANIDSIDKLNSDYIRKDLKKATETDATAANYESDDSVEISSEALNLKDMEAAAMNAPDVREEKISAIKAQIDSGTYKISSERIARQLIEEAIRE
jgi:negative regulator of flagellin synthesis FlgM